MCYVTCNILRTAHEQNKGLISSAFSGFVTFCRMLVFLLQYYPNPKTLHRRLNACCRSLSVGLASSVIDGLLLSTYPLLLCRGVENKKKFVYRSLYPSNWCNQPLSSSSPSHRQSKTTWNGQQRCEEHTHLLLV